MLENLFKAGLILIFFLTGRLRRRTLSTTFSSRWTMAQMDQLGMWVISILGVTMVIGKI